MTEPDVLDGALLPLAVITGDAEDPEPVVALPDDNGPVVDVLALFGPNICLDGPVLTGLGPRVSCGGCSAVSNGDAPGVTAGGVTAGGVTASGVTAGGVTAGGVVEVTLGAALAIAGLMDGGTEETEAVTLGIPVVSTPPVSGFLSS